MITDLSIPDDRSPFDVIRLTDEGGREYWSARDLMPLLDYDRWERFDDAVARAVAAINNSGEEAPDHIRSAAKMVTLGSGAKRHICDYHLTRYGAYIVAMNSDPRKAAVAQAQTYFAIRTREAETRPAFDPAMLTRAEILQIALNAETERLALETENRELAPKADAYDSFMDSTGYYSVGAVAKMLGHSQNWLFRELRNRGVLIAKGAMRNTPYQQYMRHFVVKAHDFERSNGDIGSSYTTYVQPSGIDFIRRKLGLPSIDPIPAGAS